VETNIHIVTNTNSHTRG